MFCFVFLSQKIGSNNSQKQVEIFHTAMAAPPYPSAWQRMQVAGVSGQPVEIFCRPAIFARGNMFGDMAAAIVIVPLGWNAFFAKVLARCFFPPFLTPGVFSIFFHWGLNR